MNYDRRTFLRNVGGVAGATLSGALPGFASTAVAQSTVAWKAITNHRNGAAWSHRWPWFLDEIKKRTNGRIVMNVTTLPELGFSGQELLRALKSNLVDFSDITAGYVGSDFPAIDAPLLPGVYKDYATTRRAVDVWTEKVVGPNESIMGGRVHSTFNFNTVYLFSKNPINKLEEIKGMKIRTFSLGQVDYISGLGGEPVSMPAADLYTALERGTINGAITGPDQVEGQRLYEVCKYMTDLQLGSSAAYSVVSRKSWDALGADLRKVMEDIAPQFTARGWEAGEINNKVGIELARTKGMTVSDVKEEWRAPLKKIAQEVVAAKWSKRVGPKVTKDFNDILGPISGITI
jgi:TRAP-type C4-dicarboxylate transport system substrate-binding protein